MFHHFRRPAASQPTSQNTDASDQNTDASEDYVATVKWLSDQMEAVLGPGGASAIHRAYSRDPNLSEFATTTPLSPTPSSVESKPRCGGCKPKTATTDGSLATARHTVKYQPLGGVVVTVDCPGFGARDVELSYISNTLIVKLPMPEGAAGSRQCRKIELNGSADLSRAKAECVHGLLRVTAPAPIPATEPKEVKILVTDPRG